MGENTPLSISATEFSKEAAIEWVMDHHGESLKRFIFTYVKNRAQMDDVFQDVMLTVYQKIDTIRDASSLKNWLYRITANKCKDYLRSPLHRLFIWKDEVFEKTTQTPEHFVLLDEQKREVIKAIMNLPIKYREVLILQYYQEFSIEEISKLLDVNPSTIRTRIMRAKEKLKVKLKEDYLNE
ncbi:sigma-70 family RNA polymerase sigma factor [Lederbergia graminis]|uniref:Sigma-70 family RNA polymerase sigma factor n=1 Tax=Lederbergia graminis TaxID=735518 RepID=A0ABW0LHF0_9BACI